MIDHCPDRSKLQDFLNGSLPSQESTEIEHHTQDCRTCLSLLSQLALDPEIAQLMTVSLRENHTAEEREFVERVHQFLHQIPSLPQPIQPIRPRPSYIGGYQILRRIASGGMATVYEAMDTRIARRVAIKMLRLGEHSEEILARLEREAEILAKLNHPNILTIYESGEFEGAPYLVLEFIAGGSLAALTERRPQDPKESAQFVIWIAEAIQAAHDQNILHRDLKPTNILVTPHSQTVSKKEENEKSLAIYAPKLADFGLSRNLDENRLTTKIGQAMGTPSYMAPEQASGEEIDKPADIYGLGAILYELLTGVPPFQSSDPVLTLKMVIEQDIISPRVMHPKVPLDLETICLKCLEKEPRKRYESAQAFAADLRRFLNGEVVTARPVSWWNKIFRYAYRHPSHTIAISSLVALIFVTISLTSVLAYIENQRRKESEIQTKRIEEEKGKVEVELQRAIDSLQNVFVHLLNQDKKGAVEAASVETANHLKMYYERYFGDFSRFEGYNIRQMLAVVDYAVILAKTGKFDEAEKIFDYINPIIEKFVSEQPNDLGAQELRIRLYFAFTEIPYQKKDLKTWSLFSTKLIAHCRELVIKSPSVISFRHHLLTSIQNHLSLLDHLLSPKEKEELNREAKELRATLGIK